MKTKRLLTSLGRIAAASLLAWVLLLLGCQSRLIYYPTRYEKADLQWFERLGGKPLAFQTGEGRQVAHWLPPRDGAPADGRIWLVCAGNASRALDWIDLCGEVDRSAGWLFIDYPGYGDCEGKPNPDTMKANLVGAVEALAAEQKTTRAALQPRLSAFGHSLGAAAALIAADEFRIRRLVLVSPFTSMTDMGKIVLGRPLCYLNRHRYDNRARLAAIAPLHPQIDIFHGLEDESIPVRMSQELAATWPDSITLHEVPGAGHNDIGVVAADQLEEALRRAGNRK